MAWTSYDEQLYQALSLEQEFSSNSTLKSLIKYDYPCTMSEVVTTREKGISYYWKMPSRWWADPLNPWNLILLVCWLPINVIYACFQGVRSLASTKNSLTPPMQDVIHLESGHFGFSRPPAGLNGPISHARIASLGYYANGLRMDLDGRRFLLGAAGAPSLFVTLRHLAPNAAITSGLIVPNDFIERCTRTGHQIDVSSMHQNPPQTWTVESKDYKPPIPVAAIVGYGLIAVFAVLIVILAI